MQFTADGLIERAPAEQAATTIVAGSRLVVIAVTFNAVLCCFSTLTKIHISAATVIVCELALLTIGIFAARERITEPAMRIIGVLVGILIALKLINPGLDLKILHDLAIAYIFYELGTLTSLRQASRTVWILVIVVLAVSSIEVTTPPFFSSLFNVWSYYVDKGVLTTTINYSNQTSFVSGIRGGSEARTFFPSILGPARFSSVFLEPVSMGNFAVIVFAWCLSVKMPTVRLSVLLVVLAGSCAVLSDSRFAFVCWFLMIALRLSPLHRSNFMVFCIPVMTMTALMIHGSVDQKGFGSPYVENDNFPGRLLFSGRLLDYWGWKQWFALAPSAIYTSDTGYAYVMNNLGLPVAVAVIALFAMVPAKTAEARSMKAMLVVYMATSLCIGANMFTIKTGALVWFLYGSTNSATRSATTYMRQTRSIFRAQMLRHSSLTRESS